MKNEEEEPKPKKKKVDYMKTHYGVKQMFTAQVTIQDGEKKHFRDYEIAVFPEDRNND